MSQRPAVSGRGLLLAALWTQLALAPAPWLAGFSALGPLAFACELVSYGRMHLGAGLLFGAVLALSLRERRLSVASGAAALLLLWPLLLAPFHVEPEVAAGAARIRLLQLNVKTESRAYAGVAALLDREEFDVVAFEEVDAAWLAALATQRERFPHRVERPRDDNFGIALWSRLPLHRAQIVEVGAAGFATLDAEVEVAGKRLRVLVAHPPPPIGARAATERDRQLLGIAALARGGHRPAVVVGDLNATPWCPVFPAMVALGALRDVPGERLPIGSWPAALPFGKIWIDHVLPSPGVRIERLEVGPDVGSDHRPLVAELVF